ncbi:sterol O-acyltransferase 1-like [Zophobas morio]|uniref:sterol O-acyltransferase 1-like n=1 Tax=Zophobas morio TaxID=2755281 RepID=UPI003082AC03
MYPKKEKTKIEKKFVIRNSVLTDIFDHHQTRNLYNFLAIFFICFSIHTLGSEYFITGRITFGFGLIRKAFLHFDKAIFVWLCSFASVCAMFYVFKMWLILTTFAKGKTIIFYWFGATCLVLYYFCSLKLVTYAIRYFEFNVIGKFFLTYEQSRLLMKVHAFVRSKISNEPSGLSFSKYLYFLFAPTLIYRDTYPRTNTINWKFVVQCLLESITIFFVLTFCAMNTFPSPERLAQKYTLSDVIFEFLDKILYTPLALTQYFLVFHTVQNLFAEMLRFGDRLFYLDWWNQHSFNAWLTEWNIIVHDWLYYYIYRDFKEYVYDNTFLARVAVFLLSFGMHEWVVYCIVGGFFPALLFAFMLMLFPLSYFKFPKTNICNVLLWCFAILSLEIFITGCGLEWYALSTSPLINPTLWEKILPRFLTCDCILKI